MVNEFLKSAGYSSEPGAAANWLTLKSELRAWLAERRVEMTQTAMKATLAELGHPVGMGPGGVTIVGNLARGSWSRPRWVAAGGRVRLVKQVA